MDFRITIPNALINEADTDQTVTSPMTRVASSVKLGALFKGLTTGGAYTARLLVAAVDDLAQAVEADSAVFNGATAEAFLKYEGLAVYAAIQLEPTVVGARIQLTKGWLLVQ